MATATTYTTSITLPDIDIDNIMAFLKIDQPSTIKTIATENDAEVLYTEEELLAQKKQLLITHYKNHVNKTLAQPVGTYLGALKIDQVKQQMKALAEQAISVGVETITI